MLYAKYKYLLSKVYDNQLVIWQLYEMFIIDQLSTFISHSIIFYFILFYFILFYFILDMKL